MAKLRAFFGGLFMGGIAGVALGILTAPKSGANLREDLAETSESLYRKAAYEIEELAEKVEQLRTRLELHDFTPAKAEKVEKIIEKAQTALEEAQSTQAQSQQVLSETDMRRNAAG